MNMRYVKINEEDMQIAEDFFENEKHYNEWFCAVGAYYRGKNFQIKTKIVQKYFNSYKKTMDRVIKGRETGGIRNQKENTESVENEFNNNNNPNTHHYTQPNIEPNRQINKINKINKIKEIKEINKIKENNFFQIFTKIWFDFYFEKFKTKPIFNSVDGQKLKSIEKKLKTKAQEFQTEWTSEVASDSFRQFLEISYKDKWRSENFSLSVIDSQFNQITAKALKNEHSNNQIEEFFINWK